MLILLLKKVGVLETEASRIPQNFIQRKNIIISWEDKCLLFLFFLFILQAVNSSSEFNWLGAFQVG